MPECMGGQDSRLLDHCTELRVLPPSQVGVPAEMCELMGPHSFRHAVEALRRVQACEGPQGKLGCVLSAWDAVLGVIGLCTDSVSADDFLPSMAYVVIQACLPTLASTVSSIVNFRCTAWPERFASSNRFASRNDLTQ